MGKCLPDEDYDGDGFQVDWELNGFTASDGTEFPLHRWGSDPNKKDLFLQLNWMKPEWETKGRSKKRQYAATEEDFGRAQRRNLGPRSLGGAAASMSGVF